MNFIDIKQMYIYIVLLSLDIVLDIVLESDIMYVIGQLSDQSQVVMWSVESNCRKEKVSRKNENDYEIV